ncbi:MAG: Mur ligase domain-containing protein, partial [Patescibacteria group bacterium]
MKKIHIIGIGGIGTSSLARHLQKNGFILSGSDQSSSSQTDALQKEGIQIFIGQKKENIAADCDLVIYSPAIAEENEEMQAATDREIQKMSYPQALGYFFQDKKN